MLGKFEFIFCDVVRFGIFGEGYLVFVWIMVVFGLFLVGLILCFVFEEKLYVKKLLIVGVFVVVCLLFGMFCGVFFFEKIVVGSYEVFFVEDLIEFEF